MTKQSIFPRWFIWLGLLVLIPGLIACSPFGGQKAAPTATLPPPPTETPLPVLPTLTPTPRPVVATATATVVAAEVQPTLTPTPKVDQPANPPVGGDGGAAKPPVAPVVYQTATVPTYGELIKNGSFEEGFDTNGVPNNWNTFDNGRAVYAWVDELQPAHVSHGQHAQLMRIMGPGEPDRFVGIYQTVEVVAGQTYTLSLHGLIRASTAGDINTPYGHRLQWAVDFEGRNSWTALDTWAEWKDTGWNDVRLGEEHPTMGVYITQIVPTSAKLTLFVRGWTKWPIMGSEAKFYVDGISLQGPIPGQEKTVTVSTTTKNVGSEEMPTTGGTALWVPIIGAVLVLGVALWEMRKSWSR